MKISLLLLIFKLTLSFGQLNVNMINENLNQPLYVTSYPKNDTTLIVLEQDGIIKKIGLNSESIFLDISDRVHKTWYPADERGLLGLAFHPNFLENSYLYLNYIDNKDNTIISRFSVKNNNGIPDSEEVILKLKQPYMNHNGGFLEFGPDGFLYISIGDGGSVGDPENRAQDLTNLFGSIIRIDVNTELGYLIPSSNPFSQNNKNIRQEIWHYGLRNVWRFSFDKLTGDMYLGDVGQSNWEEINFQPHISKGGINFGWNILEGNDCYDDKVNECDKSKTQLPIFKYPNDANYLKTIVGIKQNNVFGCSITGGYVYRGKNIPDYYGRYFFGDYCSGKVWSINSLHEKNSLIDHTDEILKSINKEEFYLSSFGEDAEGELYIIDYSGTLYSLTK